MRLNTLSSALVIVLLVAGCGSGGNEDSQTILINVGAQETNAEGVNVPPGEAQRWARLIEVTHTTPVEKVWEMRLQQDDSGWAIYRADRLAAVYPTP